MDDELPGRESIGVGLNLIGVAACVGAIMASGGLAILAGAIAVGCLAGSIGISVAAAESPGERYESECGEAPSGTSTRPPGAPGQEAGQGHHWRQTVAASRCGSRRR